MLILMLFVPQMNITHLDPDLVTWQQNKKLKLSQLLQRHFDSNHLIGS